MNNFSVTPATDPPGRVPDPPGWVPGSSIVYVPWVPHTAHKLLTPGHRSGDPWPPCRETPTPPGQSPENFVYVYVPFLRVVKTVFLENGVFVPYRKPVVLTKNGENDDLHSTHKNKGLRSSEPRNRRK